MPIVRKTDGKEHSISPGKNGSLSGRLLDGRWRARDDRQTGLRIPERVRAVDAPGTDDLTG